MLLSINLQNTVGNYLNIKNKCSFLTIVVEIEGYQNIVNVKAVNKDEGKHLTDLILL